MVEVDAGNIRVVGGAAGKMPGLAGAAGCVTALHQVKTHFPRTIHFLLKGLKSMEWSSKCTEQTPANVELLLASR